MFNKWKITVFGLIVFAMLITGCGQTQSVTITTTPTETPDLVATEVAVKKAAAATLTAEAPPATATSTAEAPPAAIEPTIAAQPTDTQRPENTPSPTATTPRCTIVANSLNLRSGPAVIFDPPQQTLPQNSILLPVARTADSSWIQVQTESDGNTGWVSAEPQFVTCNININDLPLGDVPPTPTNTPPPPTNTPPPPKRVRVPVGGGQSNLQGQIAIPNFTEAELFGDGDTVTFKDRLVFQVEVFDPTANRGNDDGAGIKKVAITIFNPNGDKVHERTEQHAGYCVFGGGEPDCNVFDLQANAHWPDTGLPIDDGFHSVQIIITTDSGYTEQWNWGFAIERR